MGKIFCVEFQRIPLKFHTKYLSHTLKDLDFIRRWKQPENAYGESERLGLHSLRLLVEGPG